MPLVLFAAMLFAQGAHAGVPIVFDLPPGMDPGKVWVQFLGTNPLTGVYRDGNGDESSLEKHTPYSFESITSPVYVGGAAPANKPAVLISEFVGGRIYVNFGDTGLKGLKEGYQPAANYDDGTGNYLMRWQYLEPTILADELDINISYIDFVGISWSIEAKNAPDGINNLVTHADGQTLADVGASAADPVDANLVPAGKKLPDPDFARALGSMQAPEGVFHDWSTYLKTTLQDKTVHLAGVYQGDDSGDYPMKQAQTYDFDVTFDQEGNATFTAQPGSGDSTADSVDPQKHYGDGIGDDVTIVIAYDELNSVDGIYGNNPANTYWIDGVKTENPQIYNDVIGWVIGDLMAGLSFGFPGSTVPFGGKTIGNLYSSQWWGGYDPSKSYTANAINREDTPAGQGVLFDKAQPGQPDNYDNWSAKVHVLGDGYTTPFQDRLGKVLMTVKNLADHPDFYVQITINPDSAHSEAIPTLSEWGILLLGGFILAAALWMRRNRAF